MAAPKKSQYQHVDEVIASLSPELVEYALYRLNQRVPSAPPAKANGVEKKRRGRRPKVQVPVEAATETAIAN